MSKFPIPSYGDDIRDEIMPQKKRILSDIQNTYSDRGSENTDNKRHSIGFDMVRIDLPSDMENDGFQTHIPPAPAGALFALKSIAEKNRKSSNIPGPSNQGKPDLNLQHINKLIGINQNLSRKPQHDKIMDNKPSLRTRLSNVEQSFTRDLTRHTEINHDLDIQLKELLVKVDDQEQELLDLKRSLKKLDHKLLDLKLSIGSQKKKFEFMEDSVMKNVLHKEKLINVQIKELSNQLQTQQNEVKFQLQDEIMKAKTYKDKTIIEEIQTLTAKIEQIQNQLEETKARKQQTLKSETSELENQLDKYMQVKVEEADRLTTIYQERQAKYDDVTLRLLSIENQIKDKKEDNDALRTSISTLESNMDNFTNIRSALIIDLEAEENNLIALESKNNEWDLKVANSQKDYDSAYNKIKIHNQQRRTIENSIMDYEGKIRVYTKLPNHIEIRNYQEFEYKNRSFKFNKCFKPDTPNYIIIEEYEALINNALSGSNCSVIFSGNTSNKLVTDSLLLSYKNIMEKAEKFQLRSWQFKFYLKCIAIDDTSVDLLSSLNTINLEGLQYDLSQVPSQMASLEDTACLSQIINNLQIPSYVKGVAYIITIEASNSQLLKNFLSNILFFDITNIKHSEQLELLKIPSVLDSSSLNDSERLISYSRCQSKCLHLTALDSTPEVETLQFLNILEVANSTDSQYKRKN